MDSAAEQSDIRPPPEHREWPEPVEVEVAVDSLLKPRVPPSGRTPRWHRQSNASCALPFIFCDVEAGLNGTHKAVSWEATAESEPCHQVPCAVGVTGRWFHRLAMPTAEPGGGPSAARNCAVARGEILSWLDSYRGGGQVIGGPDRLYSARPRRSLHGPGGRSFRR